MRPRVPAANTTILLEQNSITELEDGSDAPLNGSCQRGVPPMRFAPRESAYYLAGSSSLFPTFSGLAKVASSAKR